MDILDVLKYNVLKIQAPSFSIPTHLKFKVSFDKKNNVYWAISDELPGFVVSSEKKEELLTEIYETLLVYFDVPRYFAKKMNNYGEIKWPNGKVTRIASISMIDEKLNYASN